MLSCLAVIWGSVFLAVQLFALLFTAGLEGSKHFMAASAKVLSIAIATSRD
jgi:hypothetical protein